MNTNDRWTNKKNYVKKKGLTQEQLGNLLGVKKSAIAKYENNRVENLKKDTIQKLSEIFDVPASYFLGIDESNQPIITDSITIPLYSDISCGTGLFVDDNVDEYISLPETLLSPSKEYFLSICRWWQHDQWKYQSRWFNCIWKSNQIRNGEVGWLYNRW